jgi:hypothetical protein
MIRRLQPEPPKLDSAAQKTEKSKDSTEQESLALEFKKLLEKARGGIHGARDEVVALGLALAQAVSTVKTQQVEIRKEATAHDGSDFDEGPAVEECDVQAQVTSRQGEEVVLTSSKSDGPTTLDVEGGEPEIEGEGVADGGEGPLLDESGEEIVLDEQVVFNDLTEFVDEQVLDTETGDVSSESIAYAQGASDGEGDIELQAGFEQVEAETFNQGVTKRARTEAKGEDEASELYDEDEELISTLASPGALSGPVKEVVHRGKKEVDSSQRLSDSGESDVPRDAEFSSQNGEPKWFEPRLMNGLGTGTRSAKDSDQAARMDRRELLPDLGFDLSLGNPGSVREKNREMFLQVTLLRQAYESLKGQMQPLQDARTRASSGAVGGLNGAQQSKATETDTTPRQARYLSKAATQRMLERVETALKEAARTRDGKTISLKLDPANLGQVKVDVSLREGALHARVTPQNKEVLQSLREHAHELQGALRRLGLNVERVTVQVVGESFQQSMQDARSGFDGKSFQQERNNMPGKDAQAPENRFGNEFADVPRAGAMETGVGKADHWIA